MQLWRKNNESKYSFWISSFESQKTWIWKLSPIKVPTAVHRMGPDHKQHCEQGSKEQSTAPTAGTELGRHAPLSHAESALASPALQSHLLSVSSSPFTGAQGIALLNLCAHARRRKGFSFLSFPYCTGPMMASPQGASLASLNPQ